MNSKEFQAMCDKYEVKIVYPTSSRADHTECFNRVVKTILRSYVQQNNHCTWETGYLPSIAFVIRISRHEIKFVKKHRLCGTD